MSDKHITQDLSMEEYFTQGLAAGEEDFPPAAPPQKEHGRKSGKQSRGPEDGGKPRRNRKGFRRILICAAVFVGVIAVICLALFISVRRNDGARFANKLSGSIGKTLTAAEHDSPISLHGQSANAYVNRLVPPNSYVGDSRRSCKVQGISLPEWSIVCASNGEMLGSVTYYNFELLEKSAFGTERRSYLDPGTVKQGADPEQTEETLGLSPYMISYLSGGVQTREYRYCYDDAETGNLVCYRLTAQWDAQGGLTNITANPIDFISTILTPNAG